MLDAMVASALKKLLNSHVHLRKRVRVEEQRAQKYDRFSQTGCIHVLRAFSCNRSLWSGARNSQICSTNVHSMMMSKISTYDGTKLYYQQPRPPTEMVLEGLYKSKLQDSVQLQIVLALYDQETVRNNAQPSHSRLKTSVRLHIDQTMRTRYFRVPNEVIDGGAVIRSQKGKKANVERKVGECYQWKATGQCSKGDSCIFSHDPVSGNRCEAQRRKRQSSSPAPDSKANIDGKGKPSKTSGNKDDGFSDKRHKIPCQWRNCTNPSCGYWHPPVCQNCKPELQMPFPTCWAWWKASKKSKKGGAEGSVALLEDSVNLNCVSHRILTQGSLFHGKKENWNPFIHSPRAPDTRIKIRERKGPSRGMIQKCELHERSPYAPKFEERSQEENLQQERCARGAAWNLAKHDYKLKIRSQFKRKFGFSCDTSYVFLSCLRVYNPVFVHSTCFHGYRAHAWWRNAHTEWAAVPEHWRIKSMKSSHESRSFHYSLESVSDFESCVHNALSINGHNYDQSYKYWTSRCWPRSSRCRIGGRCNFIPKCLRITARILASSWTNWWLYSHGVPVTRALRTKRGTQDADSTRTQA